MVQIMVMEKDAVAAPSKTARTTQTAQIDVRYMGSSVDSSFSGWMWLIFGLRSSARRGANVALSK